jgi:hypothetical protein
MSLYRELRELLGGNENTLSKAQIILKERLSLGGKTLMEKVRVHMNAVSLLIFLQLANERVGESERGCGVEMTWMYFKGQMVKIVRK